MFFYLFGAYHLCKKMWQQSSLNTPIYQSQELLQLSRLFLPPYKLPPQKATVGSRAVFCRGVGQAVTDIQLAFSSGDRRLGMARMLERLCGALELEPRKLTQAQSKEFHWGRDWRFQCGTCVIRTCIFLHFKDSPHFFWLNMFNLDSYFQTREAICDISEM